MSQSKLLVSKVGRGCWAVFLEGVSEAEIFCTKKEALRRAKALARQWSGGEILTHPAVDTCEFRETDPFSSRKLMSLASRMDSYSPPRHIADVGLTTAI